MKNIIARFQVEPAEQSGISEAQIKSAFERTQMQNYPFVSLSLMGLFLLYALLQAALLRENRYPVMIVMALISTAVIFGLRRAVLRGNILQQWSDWLYVITMGLVLFSMMLRLYFTADAKQTANLAFFLVGMGMVLFPMNRFLVMTAVTLVGWLIGALIMPGDEWLFYGVVILAAAATGSIAQIMQTNTYRRVEILRIENERLYQETQQFNRQLEQKVQERTQELRKAYARLERMDKTKSDFITIASHELRTPLTILNVHNQILLFDETIQANASLLKRVNGVQNGANRMEEVVEAMLDVAKIDSQALALQLALLNLPILIRMVVQKFRAALDQRALTLEIAPMRGLPEIEADSEALEKVFYHLIINAIKYTPDGGQIRIDGRLQNTPHQLPAVEIVVADQGIGIAPDVQELIFEKFYQTGEVMLHSSGKTTFKGGGSGLGLAIAKGIVGAHHGRIWVESPGYDELACPGSAFHLVLPVKQ
jgi:signal transduction histidine kinase